MSGLMHKIKETVAPSKDESTTRTSGTGAAEYGSSTAGSNTGYGSKSSEFGSTGAGNLGSHGVGSSEYGSTGRTAGTGTAGTGAMYGNQQSHHTAGPHSSNMANKADPRVDSDLDNSRTVGRDQTYNTNTGSGVTGGSHMGGGLGSSGRTGGIGSTGGNTAGPHASNMANKLDPRVDSDRDNSATLGGSNTYGSSTTGRHTGATTGGLTGGHTSGNTGGYTGGQHTSGTAGVGSHGSGPHRSGAANTLDPRVDSTTGAAGGAAGLSSGSTGFGSGSTGLGSNTGNIGNPASRNTAGPHSSDAMNKLDPRVDSDLDGSKTMGRDQTFSRS
jgi:hypothetical protein